MFTDMGLSKDLNDQFKDRFSADAGDQQGICKWDAFHLGAFIFAYK
jgi:hypothetical protein